MKTNTTTTKKINKGYPMMGNPVPSTFKKDLHIFDDEKFICRCSHIDRDDIKFAIHKMKDMDGYVECDICGAIFNPDVINKEYVKDVVNRMLNIMETIKMINIGMDVDDEEYISFLNIIPYIKRLPYIYEKVHSDFNKLSKDVGKVEMGPYGIMPPPFVPLNDYYHSLYQIDGMTNRMGFPINPTAPEFRRFENNDTHSTEKDTLDVE